MKATPDDFERIRAFDRQHKDAGSPFYYDGQWGIHLNCERTYVYLAVKDEAIKGLLVVNDAQEETVIKHLFVAPTYRGQGVGKTLLQTALCVSDAKAYDATLYVVEGNNTAIRLYKKFGFAAQSIPGFDGIVEMTRAPIIARGPHPA